jgi:hypothetical protein
MRKHILGFAVFNLIVISFGLIYAFIYVPAIPKSDEVTQPVTPARQPAVSYDYRASCHQNKAKKISSEIISSNYYFNENKIVTKVRVTLGGAAPTPDKIFISADYSAARNLGKDGFGDRQMIANPFAIGRERIFTVVSPVSKNAGLSPRENLYVLVNVTDLDGSGLSGSSNDLTQTKEVLFVHDKTR